MPSSPSYIYPLTLEQDQATTHSAINGNTATEYLYSNSNSHNSHSHSHSQQQLNLIRGNTDDSNMDFGEWGSDLDASTLFEAFQSGNDNDNDPHAEQNDTNDHQHGTTRAMETNGNAADQENDGDEDDGNAADEETTNSQGSGGNRRTRSFSSSRYGSLGGSAWQDNEEGLHGIPSNIHNMDVTSNNNNNNSGNIVSTASGDGSSMSYTIHPLQQHQGTGHSQPQHYQQYAPTAHQQQQQTAQGPIDSSSGSSNPALHSTDGSQSQSMLHQNDTVANSNATFQQPWPSQQSAGQQQVPQQLQQYQMPAQTQQQSSNQSNHFLAFQQMLSNYSSAVEEKDAAAAAGGNASTHTNNNNNNNSAATISPPFQPPQQQQQQQVHPSSDANSIPMQGSEQQGTMTNFEATLASLQHQLAIAQRQQQYQQLQGQMQPAHQAAQSAPSTVAHTAASTANDAPAQQATHVSSNGATTATTAATGSSTSSTTTFMPPNNSSRRRSTTKSGQTKSSSSKRRKATLKQSSNNGAAGKLPPFYLFDAPIELRSNFLQNQRRLGIPVPEDCNSYHYGQTVKGFHPQQLLSYNPANVSSGISTNGAPKGGLPQTLLASVAAVSAAAASANNGSVTPPIRLMDARHGPRKQVGRVKNEREQKRAQKITELIEQLRLIMIDDGCEVEMRSKFHTLSSCADYVKKMLKRVKDKEEKISALQSELERQQCKLEDEKASDSRSDPESIESATSSLTTDSRSNKTSDSNSNDGAEDKEDEHRDHSSKRKATNISSADDQDDHCSSKKRRSEQPSSEDSYDGEELIETKRPAAQSVSIDKTISSVSDVTDSNRESSGNSGSGSSSARNSGQSSVQNSSPTDVDGESSYIADRQNVAGSISSDAAVVSGQDSRDRTGSGHKDVVFSTDSKKSRHGRKYPPQEVTSMERAFVVNYEEVFENSNIPQLIAATSGKAVSWNETFLKMTGLRNQEVERMTIFSLVKPEKLSNFFEIVAAALRGPDGSSMEAGNVTPSEDTATSQDENHGADTLAQSSSSDEEQQCEAVKTENESSSESANGSDDSSRKWNYSAMTLPCIEFPAIKKHRLAAGEGAVAEKLYVTVTLLDDENPSKRCFHCVFTDCPGTNGALGSLTPGLLAMLFSSAPKSKSRRHRRNSRHNKSHRRHHHDTVHRKKHSRKPSRPMTSKVPTGGSNNAASADAAMTGDSHSTPSSGDTSTLIDKAASSQSGNENCSNQDASNSTTARVSSSNDAISQARPTAGEACRETISTCHVTTMEAPTEADV